MTVSVVGGVNTAQVPTGTVTLSAAGGGNPDFDFGVPSASFVGSAAIVPSRAETVEVEFTNFVFNPTLLKICKIAGPASPWERRLPSTCDIEPATGLKDDLCRLASAAKHSRDRISRTGVIGRICSFAQGPFTATATTPRWAHFNVGSTVTLRKERQRRQRP